MKRRRIHLYIFKTCLFNGRCLTLIISAQVPTTEELSKLMCRDSNGFETCLAKSYSREAACNGAALCICNELSTKRVFCMPLCLEKASVVQKATGEKIMGLYQECVLDQLDKLPPGFPTAGIPTLPPGTKNTDTTTTADDTSTGKSDTENSGSASNANGQSDNATSSGFNLIPCTFLMIAAIYRIL
jgi:hypothetical protein